MTTNGAASMSHSYPSSPGYAQAAAVPAAASGTYGYRPAAAPPPSASEPTAPEPTAPEPPERGRGTWVTLMFVVLAVGVGAVAGIHGVRWARAHVSMAPTATPTPRPTNAAGADHSGDLRALLLPRPGGVKSCPDLPNNEHLTLEQEAALMDRPEERAAFLKAVGFRRGVLRCWIGTDNTVVVIELLQFDTVEHAVEYNVRNQRGNATKYGVGRDVDATAGVPGARWFATPPDRTIPGYAMIDVFAQRGDIVVDLALGQPTRVPTAKIGEAIHAQYIRL